MRNSANLGLSGFRTGNSASVLLRTRDKFELVHAQPQSRAPVTKGPYAVRMASERSVPLSAACAAASRAMGTR